MNSVFTYYLHTAIKSHPGRWNAIACEYDLAVSFHSSEVCNFISNFSTSGYVQEDNEKIPNIVSNFRKRMKYLDTHDQKCNNLKYPFKVQKASQRLFNAWDRSMQINSEIIFNFGRTKAEERSSKELLMVRVRELSEPYRAIKQWKLEENFEGSF
jgi:hypothetical protein